MIPKSVPTLIKFWTEGLANFCYACNIYLSSFLYYVQCINNQNVRVYPVHAILPVNQKL